MKTEMQLTEAHCLSPEGPPPTIFRIPIEILQIIFLLDVEQGFELCSTYNKLLIFHMLHLTQVCRQWRSAALAFPHMWFPVSFSHELFTRFLTRGEPAPLWLTKTYDFGDNQSAVAPLKSHSFRLQNIELEDIPGILTALFKDMGTYFPRLGTLKVTSDEYCRGHPPLQYPKYWSLDVQAPNVRLLKLEWVRMPLASFENLVDLSISSPEDDTSIDNIISLICRSPCLRSLELLNMQYLGPSHGPEVVTALPELEYVSISNLEDNLARFYRFLFSSAGPKVDLMIYEDYQSYCASLWEVASENCWILKAPQQLTCILHEYGEVVFLPHIPDSRASLAIRFGQCDLFDIGVLVMDPHLDVSRVTALTIQFRTTIHMELLAKFTNITKLAIFDEGWTGDQVKTLLTNPMAGTCLKVLRVVVDTNSVAKWIEVLEQRAGVGFMPLKCVTFSCADPAEHSSDAGSHSLWSEVVVYEGGYEPREWEDWRIEGKYERYR